MSGADYFHCLACGRKALYDGNDYDTPGIVVFHVECLPVTEKQTVADLVVLNQPADLAATLKAARKATGQRLQDISDASGVFKSSLSQYENDLFSPQLDRVIKWANACGYQVALVRGDQAGGDTDG